MQRTISAMVGKGSVNHNSRKFKSENVDGMLPDLLPAEEEKEANIGVWTTRHTRYALLQFADIRKAYDIFR